MSIEENKALVRRYMDEFWNRGNAGILDELCAPDCFAGFGATIAQFQTYMPELRKAVPDIKIMIEAMIAEDDAVVTRWRWTGTNTGAGERAILGRMPPVGKPFDYTGITINRIAGGRIVSDIFESNWTDMLIRMGVDVLSK